MALVKCIECGSMVSNLATSCPKCGAPVARAREDASAGAPLTTTQETSKKFKAQIVFAALLFWGGIIWSFNVDQTQNSSDFAIPSLMTVIGLLWYVIAKAMIWWHHK